MFASIPPDQIQFVIAQFGAFFFAFLYRQLSTIHRKSSKNVIKSGSSSQDVVNNDNEDEELNVTGSKTSNLLALTVPGLLISYLCYGHLVIHIVILSFVCYVLLIIISPRYVHLVTLLVAMSHLSYLHLDRLFNEFSVSAVDVTAAIMVLVQKVTCIAYGLHDGLYRSKKRDAHLTASQKAEALERVPSPLEYFAYVFNFQTIICGPLVFYSDFQDFLTGNKLKRAGLSEYPSATAVTIKNILSVSVIAILIILIRPLFPASLLTESAFSESSFLQKLLILYFIAVSTRLKYYFAWTLTETISNVSGLGYAGNDADGNPKWTLMTNIDIYTFENSLSFRDAVQAWNKTTEYWLRRIMYERSSKSYAVVNTYFLSAIWHGFHPGYYMTFLTGALFTLSSRHGRRTLRHHFVGEHRSIVVTWFYHFITWLSCRIALFYMIIPFVLLDLKSSLKVYGELYFFAHFAGLLLIFFIPKLFQK